MFVFLHRVFVHAKLLLLFSTSFIFFFTRIPLHAYPSHLLAYIIFIPFSLKLTFFSLYSYFQVTLSMPFCFFSFILLSHLYFILDFMFVFSHRVFLHAKLLSLFSTSFIFLFYTNTITCLFSSPLLLNSPPTITFYGASSFRIFYFCYSALFIFSFISFVVFCLSPFRLTSMLL